MASGAWASELRSICSGVSFATDAPGIRRMILPMRRMPGRERFHVRNVTRRVVSIRRLRRLLDQREESPAAG